MNTPGSSVDPSEFELENFLPYRLSLLTNTVSQGIAEGYQKAHGLSVTQWRVMAVLGRFSGLTAREVADRTAMDKVAVSRAVKSLEQKRLLQRKTDLQDRRCRRLFVTNGKGKRLLEAVLPKARQYEAALLESLSREELNRFDGLLSRLQSAANAINRKDS
jgi:DNA-binding MarR family transcriptional regulator